MAGNGILLTGGTGKTATRIAAQLELSGIHARQGSRGAAGPHGVRFDWAEPATYGAALNGIGAVYLVAPPGVGEPLAAMMPFLQQALGSGVRRMVLLSASSLPEGGPMMGKVHAFLRTAAPEWTVLRPSWFMQNFSEQQHLPTIRNEGLIYTATGDGRVAFVDADDIAAVGVAALLGHVESNRDFILTGPRALSYDEAAAIIADAAGRPVAHHRLTQQQLSERLSHYGIPPDFAAALAAMDGAIAGGAEDRVSLAVQEVTGRQPISFEAFAKQNRTAWQAR